MSNYRLNLPRLLDKYEAATQGKFAVAANLHDLKELNKEVAKVIVSFSVDSKDREKNFAAVATMFDGMARPIEGSFRVIPSSRVHAAVGFVTKNVETRECTASALQKYRVMAGNLLMDTEDESLWSLKTNAGSKYLTRQTEETLGELVALASLKHHGEFINAGKIDQLVTASLQQGEFAVFVSPKNMEVRAGFVLSTGEETMEVFDMQDEESEEVPHDYLVESTYLKTQEIAEEIALPAQGNKSAMKEYYKKLYSYAPDYFKMISQIIDSHAAL